MISFLTFKDENPFYFFSAVVRHFTAFHCRIGGFKIPHTLPYSTYWTWLTGRAKYGGMRNHCFIFNSQYLRFAILNCYGFIFQSWVSFMGTSGSGYNSVLVEEVESDSLDCILRCTSWVRFKSSWKSSWTSKFRVQLVAITAKSIIVDIGINFVIFSNILLVYPGRIWKNS